MESTESTESAEREARSRLEALRTIVRGYGRALVTFSGGVDSTFLLKVVAEELGEHCYALTCVSETMAASEREDAQVLGQELGLGDRHHLIQSDELAREGFAQNPVDRCALCKTELLEVAAPLAARLGVETVLIGTNTDDLGDYRPGISAAAERGARAPMVDAGLSKADVRLLSKALGLRTWDKPQLACLSSRFPYGTEITADRLSRVDRFEDGLRSLGFTELRVRFHDTIARIELTSAELARAFDPDTREAIVELGTSLGFNYVTVDLAGFRSGSLNETLVQIGKRSAQ